MVPLPEHRAAGCGPPRALLDAPASLPQHANAANVVAPMAATLLSLARTRRGHRDIRRAVPHTFQTSTLCAHHISDQTATLLVGREPSAVGRSVRIMRNRRRHTDDKHRTRRTRRTTTMHCCLRNFKAHLLTSKWRFPTFCERAVTFCSKSGMRGLMRRGSTLATELSAFQQATSTRLTDAQGRHSY